VTREPIFPGGYNDLTAPGNVDARHKRPGKRCLFPGCTAVPGTAWGPYWCVAHNIERIERIDRQLEEIVLAHRGDRP